MKLSIVIPVFNELASLGTLYDRIQQVVLKGVEKEVIFVDDGSTDGSRALLQQWLRPEENVNSKSLKVLFHVRNQGKGAALRTGFREATGDYVIVQDADLEYDPEDYQRLLDVMLGQNLKVVYGSRILESRNTKHSHLVSYLGARMLTVITNFLFGLNLTDEPTCYKMFQRELLQSLDLRCKRFEFCPEVTAKVAKRNIPIVEVPIRYYPRSWAQGKKIGWRDFFEALWTLIKERFSKQ